MKKLLCEVCWKKDASCISAMGADLCSIEWFCVCNCTVNDELYFIPFKRMQEQDWLAHMDRKEWFKYSRESFLDCWKKASQGQYEEPKPTVVKQKDWMEVV